MFRKYQFLWRLFLYILIPFALAGWSLYQSFFLKALPEYTGVKSVRGIDKDVEITRDENGVVRIAAHTDTDVYFAMGYVHAQDRLWQLELQRRLSGGRLSEVVGRSAVDQDIWMRTLGLYRAAEAAVPFLSPEAIASLEAYAAGINAWLAAKPKLPIEFSMLGIEPEPWTKIDSLAWSKVFALNMGGNFRGEMRRFIASQYLTVNQLRLIHPGYPITSDTVSTDLNSKAKLLRFVAGLMDVQDGLERNYKLGGPNIGSNAWVVSGALTDTNAPVLANDPHLGLQIPSLWYAVVQKGEKLNTSGMSLVGLPIVFLGRNRRIAWGVTNMMADTQDLYLERPDPSNPNRYQSAERWLDFDVRTESIQIKADFPSNLRNPLAPVNIRIRSSLHGPIISDVVKGGEQPIALRWTALDDNDTSYESFYRLNYAQDWSEFKTALALHVAPPMNLLYADTAGNIGFTGAGKIPIRKKGLGLVPVSGADDSYGWMGYIPFDELPRIFNPEKGYIVSANNRITDEDYPYFISLDWAAPARAQRIEQLLEERYDENRLLSIDDMKAIQADRKDLEIQRLLTRLREVDGQSKQQDEALAYLREWTGIASADSQAATIFYSWLRHLRKSIFEDEFRAFWNRSDQARHLDTIISTMSAAVIEHNLDTHPQWCDDVTTSAIEDCAAIFSLSLQNMLDEMTKLAGGDISEWRWGQLHQTLYAHTPFSQIKVLDALFERRSAGSGSVNTINVAGATFRESEGYIQRFGASFRQIMQMNENKSLHLYMNSTGQSGQLVSRYYDNMVKAFSDVEYFNLKSKLSSELPLVLTPKTQAETLQ